MISWPANEIKMIIGGRPVDPDDQDMKGYNIKENTYIIIMRIKVCCFC